MYNNPSFQVFLMATLEPYSLEWETGQDKWLIVSLGTDVGRFPDRLFKLPSIKPKWQCPESVFRWPSVCIGQGICFSMSTALYFL